APLPLRFQAGSDHSCGGSLHQFRNALIRPGLGHPDSEFSYPRNYADTLGHADRAARVEDVKCVGTLQHVIVCAKKRESLFRHISRIHVEQALALTLIDLEQLPKRLDP